MVSFSYLQLTAIALSIQAAIAAPSQGNETAESDDELFTVPFYYPSPQGGRIEGDWGWDIAYHKARKFVEQLSIPEKVNLTSGQGSLGRCVGTTGDLTEHEFRGLCLQDGPLGVRATDLVTGFPPGIAAAATWNKDLTYSRGRAIGAEFKRKGVDVLLGPVAGPLGAVALGGRNWEGSGADPSLAGSISALTARGMQDENVIACAKHFVVNEQETKRKTINSNLGDRALHEMYVRPFADMIHSGVASVMTSYNLVNNTYASENSWVLNRILKDELGFPGFVVSDWGGTHSGIASFISGQDMEQPGEFYNSGLLSAIFNQTVEAERLDDMATRVMAAFYKVNADHNRIEPNFNQGTVETYAQEYPAAKYGDVVQQNFHVDARNHFSSWVAHEVAKESIILLKNENNTLPLTKKSKHIAVLGAAAGGNSLGPTCTQLGCVSFLGHVDGAAQLGWGSGATRYPYFVTPVEGITTRAKRDGITVDYNLETEPKTTEILGFKLDPFGSTIQLADVNIIVALGNGGEELDRTTYELELEAEKVIKRATSEHSNNVIVVNAVGQVDMSNWIDHENVTAVVFAPPLGQDTGTAIAEVLFGDVDPSGRLPFTIAKDTKDYVPPTQGKNITGSAYPQDYSINEVDIYPDYRAFDKNGVEPLFEFGYGLSYTSWEFGDAKVKEIYKPKEHLPKPPALRTPHDYKTEVPDAKEAVFPDGFEKVPGWVYSYVNKTEELTQGGGYPLPDEYSTEQQKESTLAGGGIGGNPELWKPAYRIDTTVKNTGKRDGQQVAQLYVGYPTDKYENPPKQLRAFEKVHLHGGRSKRVSFELLVRDLTVWDVETQSWVVPRGEYKIYIGSSSRDTPVEATFTL